MRGKRGVDVGFGFLFWFIVGVTVLVITLIGIFILKGKGVNAIEYLKSLLRFGS